MPPWCLDSRAQRRLALSGVGMGYKAGPSLLVAATTTRLLRIPRIAPIANKKKNVLRTFFRSATRTDSTLIGCKANRLLGEPPDAYGRGTSVYVDGIRIQR